MVIENHIVGGMTQVAGQVGHLLVDDGVGDDRPPHRERLDRDCHDLGVARVYGGAVGNRLQGRDADQ